MREEGTAENAKLQPHTLTFRDNLGDEWIFKVDLQDGTVETKGKNAQKKAAKIFYEAVQIEGKTLHQKIAELENKLSQKNGMFNAQSARILARDKTIRELREQINATKCCENCDSDGTSCEYCIRHEYNLNEGREYQDNWGRSK